MQIEHLTIFFSRTTKNRKIIFIKTQKESKLLEIHQQIEKIEEIKNITEIQYRQHNTKRISIIGIPKDTEGEYLINLIKQHSNIKKSPYIKIQKVLQKPTSRYYQLVL